MRLFNFAKKWLRQAAQNPFLRNFSILLTGSVAAQALPVLASPVFSRLYSPAQFGEYALFVSTVNLLAQLVCLKYDFAILTAKTEEEAATLLRLCMRLSAGFALLLCGVLPFAGGRQWVALLPPAALFTGVYSALTYESTRRLCYRTITRAAVVKSVAMVVLQGGLFFAGLGAVALSLGQTLAYGIACAFLWKNRKQGAKPTLPLAQVAKAYAAFPKYTLPGALCNTAALSSITFFLAAFYARQELGYYALLNRALGVPLTLVAATAGQVYTKELTDLRTKPKQAQRLFYRVAALLAGISLPVFAVLFVAATPLVTLAFGAQWAQAVPMLRLLIPLFAVRFVVSPLSSTGIVLGRQLPTMLWQVSLLAAALLPAAVHLAVPLALNHYLLLQTAALSLCYLVFFYYCLRQIRQREEPAD